MWRPILLIGLVVLIFILAIVFGAGEKIGALREWIQSLGALGPAVFVGLYIFGVVVGIPLTKIPFWTYVFWSWLCMLPGTILYVVGVDAITQAIVHRNVPWPLIGVILGVGIILSILVRFARRKIKKYDGNGNHSL